MARLAGEAGLRLLEVCWLRLEDLHFTHGDPRTLAHPDLLPALTGS
jgi:hypothetical protein